MCDIRHVLGFYCLNYDHEDCLESSERCRLSEPGARFGHADAAAPALFGGDRIDGGTVAPRRDRTGRDRDRAGAEAAHLEESLRILDGQHGEAETFLLSLKNGRVSKLIQDIELVRATVTEKESVLRSAHDVLKRAFDSEDRLKNMTK